MTQSLKLHVVLDLEYDLKGADPEELKNTLQKLLAQATKADEFMSGLTTAKVTDSTIAIKVRDPVELTEDQICNYHHELVFEGKLAYCVDNPNFDRDDIPNLLTRYGMMDPIDYQKEIRGRMIKEGHMEDLGANGAKNKP